MSPVEGHGVGGGRCHVGFVLAAAHYDIQDDLCFLACRVSGTNVTDAVELKSSLHAYFFYIVMK